MIEFAALATQRAPAPHVCSPSGSMSMASDDPPKRLGGYQQAGILSRATYHFVQPVIRLGVQQRINEHTLQDLGYLPDADAAETLSAEFGATYRAVQVGRWTTVLGGAAGGRQWRVGLLPVRRATAPQLPIPRHTGASLRGAAGAAPLVQSRRPAVAHIPAPVQVAHASADVLDAV